MKGHYIVCGERTGPLFNEADDAFERYSTVGIAADVARALAEEHPGEQFFVYTSVMAFEVRVGPVVSVPLEATLESVPAASNLMASNEHGLGGSTFDGRRQASAGRTW